MGDSEGRAGQCLEGESPFMETTSSVALGGFPSSSSLEGRSHSAPAVDHQRRCLHGDASLALDMSLLVDAPRSGQLTLAYSLTLRSGQATLPVMYITLSLKMVRARAPTALSGKVWATKDLFRPTCHTSSWFQRRRRLLESLPPNW